MEAVVDTSIATATNPLLAVRHTRGHRAGAGDMESGRHGIAGEPLQVRAMILAHHPHGLQNRVWVFRLCV